MNQPEGHAAAATARGRSVPLASLTLALLVIACGPAAPSTSPASSGPPSASPFLTASASPAASPSATAASTPAVTPSPAAASPSQVAVACDLPQQVTLPSDRVVDMSVISTANTDQITFIFGESSLPGPASPPTGLLDAARPPFTEAASGQRIDLHGEHALSVRFSGMSLANDVGDETYKGTRDVRPTGASALRQVVLYDESEGVIGWYVGYDGDACVTMDTTGRNVTVTLTRS